MRSISRFRARSLQRGVRCELDFADSDEVAR